MFVFVVIKSFMSNILFKEKQESQKKIELNTSILDNLFSSSNENILDNTEMNRSFSGDSSLFSGVSKKENTDKCSDKFLNSKSLIKLLLDNFIGL